MLVHYNYIDTVCSLLAEWKKPFFKNKEKKPQNNHYMYRYMAIYKQEPHPITETLVPDYKKI